MPSQSHAVNKGFLDLKKLRVQLGDKIQGVGKLSSRAPRQFMMRAQGQAKL